MRTIRIQELKHQALMERLHLIWPIEELALIYRGFRGDRVTTRRVFRYEAYHYDVSMTFYQFVRSNWLPVYEEVMRP